MKNHTRKRHILIDILGYFFLILGLIGLLVPLFPQIPFIIIGILILGKNHHLVKKIIAKLPQFLQKKLGFRRKHREK